LIWVNAKFTVRARIDRPLRFAVSGITGQRTMERRWVARTLAVLFKAAIASPRELNKTRYCA
jgi:hypothetical protein